MKGDIILVKFPYVDTIATKIRPSLVIADDSVDIVAVYISSNVVKYDASKDILIDKTHPEYGLSGLKTDSFIKTDKIYTLNKKNYVIGSLGSLGPSLRGDFNSKFAPFYTL